MNTYQRIKSILKATNLDSSITGLKTFNLSNLNLPIEPDFQLPNNLRLGHLSEKVVSELIKSSTNYTVLYENAQLIEDKRTLGEIDFILEEHDTNQLIHMELAYKFYLFDPSISSEEIKNWIAPNRNNSLTGMLEKLKKKQFPLLYHKSAKAKLKNIDINEATQALCLLVSLFIPYESNSSFSPAYTQVIKGYYLNMDTFISLDDSAKSYYIPQKKEWGMDPADNETWTDFKGIEEGMRTSIGEERALLCWQKQEDSYSTFFITWW
jgi:hypothetical protein